MNFTQIDKLTGRVVNSGTTDSVVELQNDDTVILTDFAYFGGYVINGIHFDIPISPSINHTFNWQTKQWEDPRTLQDLKDAKWEAMKSAREAAIDAPLVTPYGTVDSKAVDRTNITDAVMMLQTLAALGQPTTIDFTMSDNTTVTLTTNQMVEVGLLLGQKVQVSHGIARARRTAIELATTPEEVEIIQW